MPIGSIINRRNYLIIDWCNETGKKVGSIKARRLSENIWNLDSLFIKEGWRKQGIGTRLLEILKEQLIHHYKARSLSVLEVGGYGYTEEEVKPFYLSRGFSILDGKMVYNLEGSEA